MSQQLREAALNVSSAKYPLLSFDVEPAAGPGARLSISSVGPTGLRGELPPKLKVKRQADGVVELSVRPVGRGPWGGAEWQDALALHQSG